MVRAQESMDSTSCRVLQAGVRAENEVTAGIKNFAQGLCSLKCEELTSGHAARLQVESRAADLIVPGCPCQLYL